METPISQPASKFLLGLRTAIYHAPDLARAKSWYSAILGVDPYFDEPFYVGFNVGGYELGLDPDPASGPAGAGGVTVYWGVAEAGTATDASFPSARPSIPPCARSAAASRWAPCSIRSATSSESSKIPTSR